MRLYLGESYRHRLFGWYLYRTEHQKTLLYDYEVQ